MENIFARIYACLLLVSILDNANGGGRSYKEIRKIADFVYYIFIIFLVTLGFFVMLSKKMLGVAFNETNKLFRIYRELSESEWRNAGLIHTRLQNAASIRKDKEEITKSDILCALALNHTSLCDMRLETEDEYVNRHDIKLSSTSFLVNPETHEVVTKEGKEEIPEETKEMFQKYLRTQYRAKMLIAQDDMYHAVYLGLELVFLKKPFGEAKPDRFNIAEIIQVFGSRAR